MKTLIALVVSCFIAAAAMAADIAAAPIFQIRLVAETPSATSEPMVKVSQTGDQAVKETLNVEKAALLDQTALKSASVSNDSLGHPVIDLTFTRKGATQFATITQANLHKRLAIVIDGHLNSAPMIQSSITGGKAQISGNFSKEEATDLANRINAIAKK